MTMTTWTGTPLPWRICAAVTRWPMATTTRCCAAARATGRAIMFMLREARGEADHRGHGPGSAPSGAARGWPGPGLDVVPVCRQRAGGARDRGWDGGLEQLVAGGLQICGGGAVGLAHAERPGDQAAGVSTWRCFPVLYHAEAFLVRDGQAGQRGVHPDQVRGPTVGEGQLRAD